MSDDDEGDLDALFDQIDEDELQENLLNQSLEKRDHEEKSLEKESDEKCDVPRSEERLRSELAEMKRKMKLMEEMLQKQSFSPLKTSDQSKQPGEVDHKSEQQSEKKPSEKRQSQPGGKRPLPSKASLSDTFRNVLPSEDCLATKSSIHSKLSDSFDFSMTNPVKPVRNNPVKAAPAVVRGAVTGVKQITDPITAADIDKCPHSGIRISNRVIAREDFNCAVASRKFLKLSQLPHHFKDKQDVAGDWVTSGVIVRKAGPYKSSNGSDYSIWSLSDLVSVDNVISVFLFKDVHMEHRKEQIGTVVSILNPSFMPPKDQEKGKKSDLSFVADNPRKIIRMGMAADYAICRHLSKAGQACRNFINKALTQYCDFHVIKVHAKMRNKRIALSGAFTPSPNQNKGVKARQECQAFTHKGSVYYPNIKPASSNDTATPGSETASVTALKKKGVMVSTPLISNTQFESMLKIQSAGSVQLKRSLDEKKMESVQQSKRAKIEPVETFKSFFKKNVEAPKLGAGFSGGDVIDLNKKNSPARTKALALAKQGAFTPNTKRKRHEMSAEERAKMMERSYGLEKKAPKKEVVLNGPSDLLYHKPLDTRKSSRASFGNKENAATQGKKSDSGKSEGKSVSKLSAAFGSITADSAEGKRLLKAQSINAGIIKEQEIERTTEYFNAVEKFERNEEKLMSITEMKVTVYICQICNTATPKQLQTCIDKGHPAKKGPAVRKFFKCSGCSFKTNVIGLPFPNHCCSKCGRTAWVKCSMYHEMKGPKLESETLVVRGEDVEVQERVK